MTLPETDSLVVEFTSRGYFHFQKFELELGLYPTSHVRLLNIGASAPLSLEDAWRFDEALRFYRLPGDGRWCTTKDEITITQVRGEVEVARENFLDDSCGVYEAGGLDFSRLAQSIEGDPVPIPAPANEGEAAQNLAKVVTRDGVSRAEAEAIVSYF